MSGGGTGGNEQLTATTGVLLIALLAVIGVTIVRIGQLTWLHLFIGSLLIGPVGLKLASTGYRFAQYYLRNASYREKGPPELVLRLIAPIVVLSTVAVFVSGIVLMYEGPRHRDPVLLIHKVSFIVWVVFAGLHVLGHVPGVRRSVHPGRQSADALGGTSPGAVGRWIAMSGAIAAGVVLALVLTAQFGVWTAHGARH